MRGTFTFVRTSRLAAAAFFVLVGPFVACGDLNAPDDTPVPPATVPGPACALTATVTSQLASFGVESQTGRVSLNSSDMTCDTESCPNTLLASPTPEDWLMLDINNPPAPGTYEIEPLGADGGAW